MNRIASASILTIITTIICASTSFSAGFRLPDQDAAALGMAGAFVGQADDSAAVWYNPAGIARLDGTRISGGVVAIFPVLTHENTTVNPGSTDVSKRMIHLPAHFYATRKMNDRISFGIGINSPFGLSTNWDANSSSTRYVSTFTKVVTAEVNPNVAYALNDNTSVAFGIAYVHLSAILEKMVNLGGASPAFDRNFRLSGGGDGWGVNAALLQKVSQTTTVGFSYRSRVKIDLTGDAELNGGPLPPALAPGAGSTSITLPDLIQFGVSSTVSDKLTLNADIDYTLWSTYDRIVVTSSNPAFNATDEKQWHDVWCLRIGVQYQLLDQWKLRAGYVYDKSPVGEARFETTTPDADRQGVTLGTGFAAGNMTVDLAYLYLRFNKRTINNSLADDDANPVTSDNSLNGAYKSMAHLAAITMGYKF